MTDKKIINIVTNFRNGILGKGSPLKKCFVVCSPLSTFLCGCGCKNELTEGEIELASHNKGISIGHFWLTLPDGRIIDPTASQFNGMGNEEMPIVYFGEKPAWYKAFATKNNRL